MNIQAADTWTVSKGIETTDISRKYRFFIEKPDTKAFIAFCVILFCAPKIYPALNSHTNPYIEGLCTCALALWAGELWIPVTICLVLRRQRISTKRLGQRATGFDGKNARFPQCSTSLTKENCLEIYLYVKDNVRILISFEEKGSYDPAIPMQGSTSWHIRSSRNWSL